MAYSRRRTTTRTSARSSYGRTNRATAARRSSRAAARSSRQQTVRIVLEAPGVRLPANTVALPPKRKPF